MNMNRTSDFEAMIAHRDTVDRQIAKEANRKKYSIEIPTHRMKGKNDVE